MEIVEIGGETFGPSKMGLSPETSSKERDLERYVLRLLMLKTELSLETSSENGDIQGAREFVVPYLGFCLDGSYFVSLKGPGSVTRPGRFPQLRPGGSPSCAPLA